MPETLLVLIGLTDGNPEIQKLVAFENAFELLFAIVEQEGGVDGGIVVQDCLQLLANLLRYNSSNQVCQLYVYAYAELLSGNSWCSSSCGSISFGRQCRSLAIPKSQQYYPLAGRYENSYPKRWGGNDKQPGIFVYLSKINLQEALARSGALNKIIDLALSFDPPSTVSAAVSISNIFVVNTRPF